MRLGAVLVTALRALRRNIMRAALTTLGIVIGVGSVIAMIEIGNGSTLAVRRTIASMGAHSIMISSGAAASGGISFGSGTEKTLTPEDAEAIMRDVPSVLAAAPVIRTGGQLVNGNRNWVPSSIFGTTPEYLVVREWTNLADGATFTERDVRSAARVCIIGSTVARELFGEEAPVGQELRLQNTSLRVVGVLAPKGANMMGWDQDDVVVAPWTTIKYRIAGRGASSSSSGANTTSTPSTSRNSLYPNSGVALFPEISSTQQLNTPNPVRFTNVDQVMVGVRSSELIPSAMSEITALLRERHRLRPSDVDDFTLRDMAELADMMTKTTGMMTMLLSCVAMISLVVGGVGIMNIMLVSVTERTREIGLRMAVGARPRDILRQFLVESIVLCLLGGIIGILLGRMVSTIATLLLDWPNAMSAGAICAAIGVSVGVGIVFGFYPAWKASRLDPIDALRYE